MKNRSRQIAHTVRVMMSMLVSLGLIIAVVTGAYHNTALAKASSGSLTVPSKSLFMRLPSYQGFVLGVIGVSESGDYLYCHQWGVNSSWTYSNSRQIPDSAETRAMGYLLEAYHGSTDPLNHAALALLIHDHFDLDSSRPAWNANRATVVSDVPGVEERARALWAEGIARAVAGTEVTMAYTQAKRRGRVSVRVTNASGQSIKNIPVTVRLKGPALFESNNSDSITVTSATNPLELKWIATGEGQVSTTQSIAVHTLDDVDSAQNFVRLGDMKEAIFQGIRFEVRKVFQPIVSTQVPAATQEAGREIRDNLTVTVKSGDAWEDGVVLNATGYVYTGLTHERVAQLAADAKIQPRDGEKAYDYIARLEQMGLKPQGIAHVDVSDAEQTHRVTAADINASAERLLLSEEGKFLTWVWVIARDEQSKQSQQWMDKDAISGLLDVKESISTRKHVTVDSTVSEHSAQLGAVLTDRITVAGFPEDHGQYAGNVQFGWKPDEKYATVSVYWSQDKPDKAEPPRDDDTHKLIGQFTYKARNGTLAVGGGKPDAFGHPVNIYADKHGYYAFVYSFSGDDRVMPVTSAWNDEWECTRVVTTVQPATIVTRVNKSTVIAGQDFADIARVTGVLAEGASVSFTAYDAVESESDMGLSKTLVEETRVTITPAMKQADGSYEVISPKVRTHKPGIVYWKATLRDANGTILASHGLGAPGEETNVKPPPDTPKTPPSPPQPLARTGVSIVRIVMGCGLALLAYATLMAWRAVCFSVRKHSGVPER
ncbi:cell wall anchor protein [Alloscardovia omnicolens]|uniref:cell wall anchor protein n=1 Tax=Alloscardovia omnicolens TaxID=419015 RepID=UPI003A63BE7F